MGRVQNRGVFQNHNLTVKTLRYYDEQSILTPSFRSEENGYRFYNTNDFKKAERIKLLRNLEFSISEMKDMLGRSKRLPI